MIGPKNTARQQSPYLLKVIGLILFTRNKFGKCWAETIMCLLNFGKQYSNFQLKSLFSIILPLFKGEKEKLFIMVCENSK